MIGVILGAGKGNRLSPITSYIPKPLLPLGEKRIIDYAIEGLLDITDGVLVVVGHLGEMVERHIARRYGDRVGVYKVPSVTQGNLTSLLVVGELLRGREFLVTNADHVFPPSFFVDFMKRRSKENKVVLAGHRERDIQEDEMKVRTSSGGILLNIGKRLKSYDGAYIGVCHVPEALSEAFIAVAENIVSPFACVEDIFMHIPSVVDWVDEYPVIEIDTWEDWRSAIKKGGVCYEASG